MSSNDPKPPNTAGGGMGKSTPLVTIPAAPPAAPIAPLIANNNNNQMTSSTTTSVSATDHPLSANNPNPPPPPPPPLLSKPSATTTATTTASHRQEPSAPVSQSKLNQPHAQQQQQQATPTSINASRSIAAKAMTMNPASLGFSSNPNSSTNNTNAPPPNLGQSTVAVPKALDMMTNSQQHLSIDEMADAFFLREGNDPHSQQAQQSHATILLRPLPLPDTATEIERVRILVERRAWGDVLSLTTSLLKGPSSHYASIYAVFVNPQNKTSPPNLLPPEQLDEFMELLLLHLISLMTMRRYNDVRKEVEGWLYCKYNNPISNVGGDASWIPWKVHILAAASLQYTGSDADAAPTALWKIRQDVQAQLPNTVLDLIHVDHTLSNIFAAQGEWRMALESLERISQHLAPGAALLLKTNDNDNTTTDPACQVLVDACQCELWSRQGRILLQMGALEGAQMLMEQASSLWQDVPHQDHLERLEQQNPAARCILQQVEPQLEANFGLLHFAFQKYDLALEYFRKALQIMEANMSSSDSGDGASTLSYQYRMTDWMGGGLLSPVSQHTLYSEVTSNLAVTALYTCRLQEAVHVLEHLIRQNPSHALTERSALNLCTLYELSGDAASATRKKRTLQHIAKRFFLHDVMPDAFRL